MQYKAALKDRAFPGNLPDGTYTVIKCGGANSEDFATFVVLVPEQNGKAFDIFKPDYEYRIIKGVSAVEAMQMALDFVKNHAEFLRAGSRAIVMPEGQIAGYEVKALYRQLFLGQEDLFDVSYFLKQDNRIEVRIRLDDVVRRRFS
jgi:hypothetical protein